MAPSIEIRKLAAVMFADIEGYTALFQRNESAAMKQVEDHRKDLEEITGNHKGEIIQFYGDGSVTVFDSVIEAIQSAIEFQHISAQHRIPIRIGIHMGDLVFKDGDIFGDVVNVASRIQSLGIPGSILISRKVVDEIKNHPEINSSRLGTFNLKNVKDPVEIFALTASGLAVPPIQIPVQKKVPGRRMLFPLSIALLIGMSYILYSKLNKPDKTAFEDERIVIPPFVDYTLNAAYAGIGELASSYITSDLSASADADIVSYLSGQLATNADMASMNQNPALARRTGARYLFKGSYSLTGASKDTLQFWVSIIDTKTNSTLKVDIPRTSCRAEDHMDCIQDMSAILKGFWKSRKDHALSISNDKAYSAFQKALKLWADPDPDIKAQAKGYLLQALTYDSLYVEPYIFLLYSFINEGNFESESDTLKLMQRRLTDLTDRQANYISYFEEDLKGKNSSAFTYFLKEYENNPKDLFINTDGMVQAIENLNDPLIALSFHKEIDLDGYDLNTCIYCRTRVNMAMQAFAQLSDQNNARVLADRLKSVAEKKGQVISLIAFYLNTGDTSSVSELIDKAEKKAPSSGVRPYYYMMAAQYAMLDGNLSLRDYYANQAIRLYGTNANRRLARCHYLKGDFETAKKLYLGLVEKNPDDLLLQSELGFVYARLGESKKANAIISIIEKRKQPYDFGETPYFQGTIKALLGEYGPAFKYFNTALDEGEKYRVGNTFQHDPDLIGLHGQPEYIRLLARNRLK